MDSKIIELRWTTSRAQDSYGWNRVSLYENGKRRAVAVGGNYCMNGAVIGDYISYRFQEELHKRFETRQEEIKDFYGLSRHSKPGGRVRFAVDGATGVDCMKELLKTLGYKLRYVSNTSKSDTYLLEEIKNEND